MRKLLFLFTILTIATRLVAQEGEEQIDRVVKIEDFLVTKNTSYNDLIYLFHTNKAQLKKLNKKNSNGNMFYPGAVVRLPVPTVPKVWNPFSTTESNNLPSVFDYEIDYDGLEPEVKNAFISFNQITTDSFHLIVLQNQQKKIDAKIKSLSNSIDSLKNSDFGEGLSQDNNEDVLLMMQIAKNKYYNQSRHGREIDSLNKQKDNIRKISSKIRNRISEYEYLMENHEYFVKEKGVDKKSYWENTIIQKSRYKREKNEKLTAEDIINEKEAERKAIKKAAKSAKENTVNKQEEKVEKSVVRKQEIEATKHENGSPKDTIAEKIQIETKNSNTINTVNNKRNPTKEIELTQQQTTTINTSKNTINNNTRLQSAEEKMKMTEEEREELSEILNNYKSDTFINSLNTTVIAVKTDKNIPTYLIAPEQGKKLKGDFYYTKARDFIEHNNLKEGERFLVKSLDENPNNIEAWIMHADINILSGNTENAAREYRIALEIDSNNTKAMYNLGYLYFMSNNHNKAMEFFNDVININPAYYKAYLGRAKVFESSREFQNALSQYNEAQKYANNTAVTKGKALVLVQLRQFDEAEKLLKNLIVENKADGEVYYNYAMLFLSKADYTKACEYFQLSATKGFASAKNAIRQFCK